MKNQVIRVISLLLVLVLVSACAAKNKPKPYFEGALVLPLESSTDYWVHPDRTWQCDPPWIDMEAGLEWRNGTKLGLHHESTLLCGSFNDRPEIYWNGIRLSKKWGGY